MNASHASSSGYAAIPQGSSVDDIEALYSAFYTQRLADECRFLAAKVATLESGYEKRDLNRRLRIARRLLAARQLKMF